jgi:thiosulfate/3-mercaptopyruvate sulfurtransferase
MLILSIQIRRRIIVRRQIHTLQMLCFFALLMVGFTIQLRVHADAPWKAEDLIQPADLKGLLASDDKPLVLQTGVVHLYKMGHIPGSFYAGMASTPEGILALKKTVQDMPHTREIVIYCGCCPMGDCPNIRPAFQTLRIMGFKNVKVLNLPTNFTQDWQMKGYPVEKSASS